MQINFDGLRLPLAGQRGCGPDLENDWHVGQLIAELDGMLPSKAEDYYAFRVRPPDLTRKVEDLVAALSRTRDLRLMIPLARIAALSGDLAMFENATGLIRHYVDASWADVHPRPEDGDYNLRVTEIERLDEFASVILPLHYSRLIEDKAGQVAWRDVVVAAGEAKPRQGETFATADEIDRLFKFAGLDVLSQQRDRMLAIAQDLRTVVMRFLEEAGQTPSLPRLTGLIEKVAARLTEVLQERGADGPTSTSSAPPAPDDNLLTTGQVAAPQLSGRVRDQTDAAAALGAVSTYFALTEPSSPAMLVVRQAKALIGLTFPQILQKVAPTKLGAARVILPGPSGFTLSLEALGTEFAPEPPSAPLGKPTFGATTRAEAAALIVDVAQFYRSSEPSNPIPLLLDKGRDLMAKDFSVLLGELTPKP